MFARLISPGPRRPDALPAPTPGAEDRPDPRSRIRILMALGVNLAGLALVSVLGSVWLDGPCPSAGAKAALCGPRYASAPTP